MNKAMPRTFKDRGDMTPVFFRVLINQYPLGQRARASGQLENIIHNKYMVDTKCHNLFGDRVRVRVKIRVRDRVRGPNTNPNLNLNPNPNLNPIPDPITK